MKWYIFDNRFFKPAFDELQFNTLDSAIEYVNEIDPGNLANYTFGH